MSVELSVITVTYNSQRFIDKFLVSLVLNLPPRSELIIVDSASEDGTVKIIEDSIKKYERIPIVLIKSTSNIGFSKGNNIGAKHSRGKYLLILNPDTEVYRGSIARLLSFAQDGKDIGLVAPKLIQPGNLTQPSVRNLPTAWRAFKEFYIGIKNSYQPYTPASEAPITVESVVGAAMLIKRDYFLSLGGFNEKFFMYFEDLDLCRKILKSGKKIYYLPQAQIKHIVGGTQTYPKKNLVWLKDSSKRYHGFLGSIVLELLLRLRPRQ